MDMSLSVANWYLQLTCLTFNRPCLISQVRPSRSLSVSAVVKIGAHLSFVVIDPGPGTKYEVGAGEQQTRPISHYSTLQISHQSPVSLQPTLHYTSHVPRRRVKARTFNIIFVEK